MAQNDLIQKLVEFREKKKMSHKRLAHMLQISPNTLGQWFQGHRKLRADECTRLENFFLKNK